MPPVLSPFALVYVKMGGSLAFGIYHEYLFRFNDVGFDDLWSGLLSLKGQGKGARHEQSRVQPHDLILRF
jgi:hypothetical protein